MFMLEIAGVKILEECLSEKKVSLVDMDYCGQRQGLTQVCPCPTYQACGWCDHVLHWPYHGVWLCYQGAPRDWAVHHSSVAEYLSV